jgi:ubiquinone/menaquinone biosynthesis C-methylase UbiE
MDKNSNTYSLPKVIKHYAEYSDVLQKPEQTIFNILETKLENMKVLDIGVGGGRTTTFLAPKVKEYIGVDFSQGMIDVCKKKFSSILPFAKFEVCDVRDLSKFQTGYFDLVLFSFNGIDNISHADRAAALLEIKRICAPGGYFCFSSHNLQSLPEFFKIRFRLHPIKFFKSLIHRKKLLEQNKEQITQIATANYVNIYDDVYDFGLHTHYIRPEQQVIDLKTEGFKEVRVFNLEKGKELKPEELKQSTDSWLYYLSTKI